MNLLGKREIASVRLFTVEISESELDTQIMHGGMNKECLTEEGNNERCTANNGTVKGRDRQVMHFRIEIILKKSMNKMMAEWCTSARMAERIFLMATTIIQAFIRRGLTASAKLDLVVGAKSNDCLPKSR